MYSSFLLSRFSSPLYPFVWIIGLLLFGRVLAQTSVPGVPDIRSTLDATRAGGADYDEGVAIATDREGNRYIVGNFKGKAAFGSATLVSTGKSDVFVWKINSEGLTQWVRQAGGINHDQGDAIVLDEANNVYVTGHFRSKAGFGSPLSADSLTSSGERDVFVWKLNSSGEYQWAKKGGGVSHDYGQSIALDGASNIHITGFFRGTAIFGSTELTSSNSGSSDVFVWKLNSSGAHQWATKAGGTYSSEGQGIALDNSGHIYITGAFFNEATFGSVTLNSSGYYDVFVWKLNSEGGTVWAKGGGGTGNDHGYAIGLDGAGNAYATGHFEGSAQLGEATLNSTGQQDAFVWKLNSNGAHQWAIKAGGTSYDAGRDIALDQVNNIYVTGAFDGKGSSVPHDSVQSYGGVDVFVWALNDSGHTQWIKCAGGEHEDSGRGIAVDHTNQVHAVGYFRGESTFEGVQLSSQGEADAFVWRVHPISPTVPPTPPTPIQGHIYVDASATGAKNGTSWRDAFDNLSTALSSAEEGDSIFVKSGTYKPHGHKKSRSFVIRDRVYVYGGFAGIERSLGERHLKRTNFSPSILSGAISADQKVYQVVYITRRSLGAVLDGFVIKGGEAREDANHCNYRGGGIYVGSDYVTLSNLEVKNNQAPFGGGIYVNGRAIILHSEIHHNTALASGGGIYVHRRGEITLKHSQVHHNTASASGGGIYAPGAAFIHHSALHHNTANSARGAADSKGGGLLIGNGTVSHSQIHHNRASRGGGVFMHAGALTNSIIHHNDAYVTEGGGYGGGVYMFGKGGGLINNTVYGNTATGPVDAAGGGLYLARGRITHGANAVANTLIYGNTLGQGGNTLGHSRAGPEVYNANTRGVPYTFGNNLVKGADESTAIQGPEGHSISIAYCVWTTEDPFASTDSSSDNFLHLRQHSPALDKGSSSYVWEEEITDLAGQPRLSGAAVDIGAYEYPNPLPPRTDQAITDIILSPECPQVAHGTAANTHVAAILATHTGIGDNPTISYRIKECQAAHAFKVEGNSLKTNQVIDHTALGELVRLSLSAHYTTEEGVELTHKKDIGIAILPPPPPPAKGYIRLSGNKKVLNGAPSGTLVGVLFLRGVGLIPTDSIQVPTDSSGIIYAIEGGNTSNTFTVEGNALRVATPPVRREHATYDLRISASYPGDENPTYEKTFTITITENENPQPQTQITDIVGVNGNDISTLRVREGAIKRTLLTSLKAIGTNLPDSEWAITYTIQGNSPETFEIAKVRIYVRKGVALLVKRPPVRSEKAKYNLHITASYAGASFTKEVTVIVVPPPKSVAHITDIQLSGTKKVVEGAPVGEVVGRLSATGKGLPTDETGITYAITAGNNLNTFAIEGNVLRVANPPVRSEKAIYKLRISATYLSLTHTKAFNIRIVEGTRIADIQLSGAKEVVEGAPIGRAVGRLSATGKGLPVNGTGITYAITAGNTPNTFAVKSIDNTIGLFVKRPPVHSEKAIYNLRISASYNGATYAKTFRIRVVEGAHIADDEEVVHFTNINLSGAQAISKDAIVGTLIGTLSASGEGLPNDGDGIAYAIADCALNPHGFEIEGAHLKVKAPPAPNAHEACVLNISATYAGITHSTDFVIRITEPLAPLSTPQRLSTKVYPNPTLDVVRVSGLSTGDKLRLLNTQGQVVLTDTASESIDLSGLRAGVYILEILGADGKVRHQLLKQ